MPDKRGRSVGIMCGLGVTIGAAIGAVICSMTGDWKLLVIAVGTGAGIGPVFGSSIDLMSDKRGSAGGIMCSTGLTIGAAIGAVIGSMTGDGKLIGIAVGFGAGIGVVIGPVFGSWIDRQR